MKLRTVSTAILAATLAAVTASPTAFAHNHVHKTSITENAQLAASPAKFTVDFESKTTLARVVLTDAAGKAVPLAYVPPRKSAASYSIPLPKLPVGVYVLSWRTIARDGHAMPGMVHFTITGG